MSKKKTPPTSKPSPDSQPANPTLIQRYFTNGAHPFKTVQWERRDALIEGLDSKPAFEQRDVSFPADWSQNATNIVAQKYFAGQLGSESREWSVKQLIGRVVERIGAEGMKNGYFQDEAEQEIFEHELAHILVHQMAAFNSPVWFNIGVEGIPQVCSACFILHVDDQLKDITRWYSEEAMIFQNGSGAGLNLSNLRGSQESLSRGGYSSGPVTFMRAADSSAGTITSGGRCLAPDQAVYTQNGPQTVQRLARSGQDFQVYSWDGETDTLVLRTARAWRQEQPKPLVEVQVVVYDEHLSAEGRGRFCTSLDHPYRMHDGSYLPAMELSPGMEISAGILEVQDGPVAALARVEGVIHGTECEVYDIEVDWDGPDDRSPVSGHNFLMWDGDAQQGVGAIVSNTRRAAKMVILDADHPDVEDFIWCKAHEEKKARALAAAGFDMSLNTPEGEKNWASLQYQNANNSVRLTDSFLKAVEGDEDWQLISRTTGEPMKTIKARDLLQQIADAAWECADPGVQYDTTINSWHTCPNHSRITASNPCSEFLHVDDSSCNLASLNLMKFRQEDGTFDVDMFRHAAGVMFLAQEILISFADFPTELIAKHTRDMRQIGLGYSNLGAYLMASGLPYDSEQGRQVAGAITALMHCEAYAQSARIASRMGPYAEYVNNQESHLRVLKRHRTAANKLEAWEGDVTLTRAAKRAAKDMVELAEQFGVRNSQATVLAPAGTISFLMDCDTTGVEPDFSLVKYKKLVGGGSMTIVNNTVPQALARLSYEPHQVGEIVEYIREHNSVVGAPHIKEDDYPVFDTAIGQRAIHYMGHLKMLAAVQPSLSGSVSKTVNLPADVTREEIFQLYLEAWRMGLKAVAIYRDGTKTAQPLGDGKDEENLITSLLGDGLLRGQRRRVPDDGQAIKRRFEITSSQSGNVSGHIVVGLFEDGTPGELFVNVSQAGSTLRGFIDTWARLFSMALQYGAPLEDLIAKQVFTQFEPAGFTNDREIARAKSIPDYVVRWMAARFLDPDYHQMLGINTPESILESEVELAEAQKVQPRVQVKKATGPNAPKPELVKPEITMSGTGTCSKCGGLMVQTGKCMTCTDCGDTGGCG